MQKRLTSKGTDAGRRSDSQQRRQQSQSVQHAAHHKGPQTETARESRVVKVERNARLCYSRRRWQRRRDSSRPGSCCRRLQRCCLLLLLQLSGSRLVHRVTEGTRDRILVLRGWSGCGCRRCWGCSCVLRRGILSLDRGVHLDLLLLLLWMKLLRQMNGGC